ncbi:hypothetical protein ACR52_19875 [Pseudomonas fildesensis]|uniref:Uncharacterized protein n=1 Tax=Pseudomonas fildesensis TaxID=1674920 RepID=A0A0J8IPQ4_9PSED|nr:hypothetical protein ACR52_19875 [Pseudomonas fildesensis]
MLGAGIKAPCYQREQQICNSLDLPVLIFRFVQNPRRICTIASRGMPVSVLWFSALVAKARSSIN